MNNLTIPQLAKKMKLENLEKTFEKHLLEADKENLSYKEFLLKILSDEVSQIELREYERRYKKANLPYSKKLEEFDFTFQTSISQRKVNILSDLDWIDKLYKLVFLGPPGVGKTHLAIALGCLALEKGYRVVFTTMSDLIDTLKKRGINAKARTTYTKILKSNLLIIDELGYLPVSREEANLFFRLISEIDESIALIITSNKGFSDWSELLGDPILASAVLDRISFRCEVMNMSGKSYRLENGSRLF